MATSIHPWIDEGLDNDEMEAVLVAQNTLPEWERGQIIRAFQTHQWSNASTDDERLCFAHDETGTIVCHDGAIVGIECGQGDLGDALPDLILVLSDLGWNGVYVYSLAEHINGVMTDLGRSIPAHLDFDVQEAPRGTPVSEMPETQELLDRGRSIRQSAGFSAADDNKDIFGSLTTEEGLFSQSEATAPVAISLDDDTLLGGDDVSLSPTLQQHVSRVVVEDTPDDGAPRVFNFADDNTDYSRIETSPAEIMVLVQENETEPSAALLHPSPFAVERELVQPAHMHQPTEQSTASSSCQEVSQHIDPTVDTERTNTLVHVGNSAFYFDIDGRNELIDEQILVDAFDPSLPSNSVVHLWPGDGKLSCFWNVLNEIDLNEPLMADTFVRWAFPASDREEPNEPASTWILRQKRQNPGLSLRDFVGCPYSSINRRLAPLSLIPNGEAFIDVPSNCDIYPQDTRETFTVREVALSPARTLFVVHLDALDGPFVQWIVDLLQRVATGYGQSARYERKRLALQNSDVVPREDEALVAKADGINQEVQSMLSDFVQRLQKMGVVIPS